MLHLYIIAGFYLSGLNQFQHSKSRTIPASHAGNTRQFMPSDDHTSSDSVVIQYSIVRQDDFTVSGQGPWGRDYAQTYSVR